MATFPTYARILFSGLSVQRESALLRTEMESGPPKLARIKSRVMVTRTVTILLKSIADYRKFIEWFSVDLNEGSAWFDFTDAVSGAVMQGRFAGDGIDASPVGSLRSWVIKQKIETWG